MTADTPSPLETWLAKHVADVERLRSAPSFRNSRETAELWERLISESEVLERIPEPVPSWRDPFRFLAPIGARK